VCEKLAQGCYPKAQGRESNQRSLSRTYNALTITPVDQAPDLQNILSQSCDYLTIMPNLRSTYDGRFIGQKHLTKGARLL